MKSNSQEKEDDYDDEDNMGRDNYFSLDRRDDSCDSDSNEENLSKTIPNYDEYLKSNDNDEEKEIVENPLINLDNNIIDNTNEDNINMENNKISKNKSLSNVNNSPNKTFLNNSCFFSENIINPENKNNENDIPANKKTNNISPNIEKNENNKINNNIRKEEGEIIESISSDDDDLKVITNDQFVNHFQKINDSGVKINVINSNIPSNNNKFNEILKKNKKKKFQEDDKILDAFFMEKEVKNNKNNQIPKKNNNINNFNKNKNIKFREFTPIPKEDFRTNTYFEKLLINRVEHQILTNIYNTYENKETFGQTYYYINEIKNIITRKGVEEAIKYLDNIEPMELRAKIAIESTYFFKEVVKEEVENAKAHNGELILIKQPEYFYNQNMKLSGKINHNNTFRRKGNSIMRYNHPNFHMGNFGRNQFNGINNNRGYGIYNNRFNNINPNNFVYNGNMIPNMRMNENDMNDE